MRVTNMFPEVNYDMQQTQQALSTALEEVSTGQSVNQPSDNPAAAAQDVISLATSADVDQYESNINTLQSQMQTSDSAISSIVTSLNSAITAGVTGATSTNSSADMQSAIEQVENSLSSIVSSANTSFQGIYLFGGSETTQPPFQAAASSFVSGNGTAADPLSLSTPLTPGSTVSITDASSGQTTTFKAAAGNTIQDLVNALPAGVTASINSSGQLEIDSSSSGGIAVNSDEPVLGGMSAASGATIANSYAYVGNSTVNQVQVGDSLNVATNLPGNQLIAGNPSVIASLGNLITALQGGSTSQINNAVSAVTSSLNYVDAQRASLDNTLSNLSSQDSYLSQEQVNLTSEQTSLVGINEAEAASNLSQAEEANDMTLAAAAKVVPQTLLNYLQQ